jgi:hypothetical protein
MKYSNLLSVIGAFLATAVFAGIASADVAPPEDYVETCTLEQQQKPGEQCVACQATYFDDPNPCQEQYGPLGYSNRCKSWGTSHTEIWCQDSAQGAGGSAGAGGTEPAEAGASSARPDPGSGGTESFAPTGGAGARPESTTGGADANSESTTGGSGTAPAAGTGAAPSSPDHADSEDESGCSLAAPGSVPSGTLPGLGIALALLGARRRARRE